MKITGTLDAKSNTIHIVSIEPKYRKLVLSSPFSVPSKGDWGELPAENWELGTAVILFPMKLFGNKKPSPELITSGRFEMERDGQVAYLDYKLAGSVLELSHTEVPEALRGQGLASALAQTALDWARANHKKVDVVCPQVGRYLEEHPEYSDLLLR